MSTIRNHPQDDICARALKNHEALIVGLIDGRQIRIEPREVRPYDLDTDHGTITKLDLLYAFTTKTAKKFKKYARKDASVANAGLKPAVRFRDRLWISKMVLQRLIDESLNTRFVLMDGTTIPCRVRSFGNYEIDGTIKGGPITFFRHGIAQLVVGEEVLVFDSRLTGD